MNENKQKTTRRRFLKNSTIAAASVTLGLNTIGTPIIRSARGANERIRVGFIGVGNRGTQLLRGFLKQDDVEVAALCDVYEPYLARDYSKVDKKLLNSLGSRVPKMTEKLGSSVARYKDFRRLLDRKDSGFGKTKHPACILRNVSLGNNCCIRIWCVCLDPCADCQSVWIEVEVFFAVGNCCDAAVVEELNSAARVVVAADDKVRIVHRPAVSRGAGDDFLDRVVKVAVKFPPSNESLGH